MDLVYRIVRVAWHSRVLYDAARSLWADAEGYGGL